MRIFLIGFLLGACTSCIIKKEINLTVDKESDAKIEIHMTGSEVKDNKADGEIGLMPL